jgi:outer membrane immunogenic protein
MDRKSYLLAAAAGISLLDASQALAAPPAPPFSWTGWYIGGNAGYSWGRAESSYIDTGFASIGLPTSYAGSEALNGFVGGGQTGYNWQIDNWTVVGLETDFQGTGEKGTATFNFISDCEGVCSISNTQSAKISWFGTVRGRFGYLLTPTLWAYTTAGLAYGQITASGNVLDSNCGCSWSYGKTSTNVGVAAGAGLEGLMQSSFGKWSWKVEYLYVNLGSVGGTGIDPDFQSQYVWSAKVTDNIVRFGINLYLP